MSERRGMVVQDLEEIAARGCQVPGCAHRGDHALVLSARCHPGRGVDVSYRQGEGYLAVVCHVCEKLVAEVQVEARVEDAS